jgi:anion-transporting  ArsA/GET3 family ATPase
VATALATRFARAGQRTLLVVQQQSDLPHPQLGLIASYDAVRVESNLDVCSVDGGSALKEYVHRTVLLPNLYDWFLNSTALKHFTEAAPGFDELMCLGKLYDLVSDSKYDQVVFDGPATGHAALMLRVPRTTSAAVRTGPLHHNALKIQLMLENDLKTRIVIVALAEEMAVREALDLATYVTGDLGMHLAPLVVNRLTRQLFDRAEIDALVSAGGASPALTRITRAAAARFERASAEAQYLTTLREQRPRLVEVPQIVLARHDSALLINGIAGSLGDFDGAGRG